MEGVLTLAPSSSVYFSWVFLMSSPAMFTLTFRLTCWLRKKKAVDTRGSNFHLKMRAGPTCQKFRVSLQDLSPGPVVATRFLCLRARASSDPLQLR